MDGGITMLGVHEFIIRAGGVDSAESLLRRHYTTKRARRGRIDRRYAAMEFAMSWAPRLRHRGKQLLLTA